MKHIFLSFSLVLLVSFSVQSQNVLLFPESNYPIASKNSIASCMASIAPLVHQMDIDKIEKLFLTKNPSLIKSPTGEKRLQDFRSAAYQLLSQGEREIAGEIFTKLLKVRAKKDGTKSIEYANALVDLGRAYILLIKYKNAIGLYEEALTIVSQLDPNNTLHVTLLNELGMLTTRAQEHTKAIRFFNQGLEAIQTKNTASTTHKAILTNNLGACYKSLRQYKKAVAYYQEALQLYPRKTGTSASMAANLAEALIYIGQSDKAASLLASYEPAGEKAWQTKNSDNTRGWAQFALAYITLGDFDKAETALQKAFIANSLTFDQITNIPNQAQDLMFDNSFLATCSQAGTMLYSIELYKARYQATNDIKYLKEGYKVVSAMTDFGEKLMNSYAVEENKLVLFQLGASVLFDRSMYYAYELYQATGDQKYLNKAFFWAERSKSTLLVSALSNQGSQPYIDLPKDIKEQEKQLQNQSKTLDKYLAEAPNNTEKQKTIQQINRLQLKIEAFKEELKVDYPEYYQHRYETKIVAVSELQQNLTDNQVLVEYFLGIQYNYVFTITKEGATMTALDVSSNTFRENTRLLRKVLTDYQYIAKSPKKAQEQFVTTSNYFYKTFVQSAIAKIPSNKHLIIIPDGALGHLPFEIFLTEYTQEKMDYSTMKYLLHQYSISYGYSATIYLTQKNQNKKRQIAKKGVLAFAADYENIGISETSVRGKRGDKITNIRKNLEPLPGAKAEVAALRHHLYGEFFDDNNANEEVFKATASDYSIIHLAMHGMLDTRSPVLSSLIFSEDATTQEDNFLRAYEIAQMDLNADLVVLSACETGYGKFQQGEGIMSLAHSFTYAGASSVLNSLWQVNDFSTGLIMKNYYTNLAKGFTKDKALQSAKLDYLKEATSSKAKHPAYWAAFVQQGNIQPLELVCRSGFTFRQLSYIAMAAMVLVVGSFVWWKKRKKRA